MSVLRATTDGVVVIRPIEPGDAELLIAGRDDAFYRFIGPGADEPRPVGCVVVDDVLAGWVDYDLEHEWLQPGEVNVGYFLFVPFRGKGYAARAVQLLMHHLALNGEHHTATLLIDGANAPSLALAARTRFPRVEDLDGHPYFKRPVPPLSYSDGVVTIRRHRVEAFGTGPKWSFAVDGETDDDIARVDCDLASEHAPAGDAFISYTAYPEHPGVDGVSRAVRLLTRFVADHTGARAAHLIADAGDTDAGRIARAAGAVETERWVSDEGRTMIRRVADLTA
jgi:RimJ/RimL family protein N-acetyltransferase